MERDQVRQRRGQPHDQADRTTLQAPVDRLLELPAEPEDLVGVLQHHLPLRRELHPPAGALEQLLPERVLQLPDLRAHRRLAHVERLGRRRHAPLVGHGVEVPQVVIVQRRHRALSDVAGRLRRASRARSNETPVASR